MRIAPPRDAQGNVIPHDHQEILSEHNVIRHIVPPQDLHRDQTTGITRVASGAYSESSEGGMSVDIEDWMTVDGVPPLHYVTDDSQGAVRLNVGALRGEGLKIGWDPLPENEHHGAVWGIGNGSGRRKRIARLADTIRKARGED
jgi:hypothetical protein